MGLPSLNGKVFLLVKRVDLERNMSGNDKVKGPASYFPSIEKKYGYPVTHWFDLLEGQADLKHMEMVAWLKTEHGIGHGHANALVAYFRSHESG